MKVRIIDREDGGVSVIHPTLNSCKEGETEQEWLSRVFDPITPVDRHYEDIDIDITPLPDREYRDAWVRNPEGGVMVCPDKVTMIQEQREIMK